MALPSSPPLLQDDLPILPTLSPSRPQSRKRRHSDYGSLSSDPIFSEYDSEAEQGVDELPKCKRLVKGPWWHHEGRKAVDSGLRRAMVKKDKKMRAADSGVWMGSDESESSQDSLDGSHRHFEGLVVGQRLSKIPSSQATVPDGEAIAAQTVLRCVEDNKETVDLSSLGLTELSSDTIQPLNQLIRLSSATLCRPPSPESFSPFTPSIQLYLYGNALRTLPFELWNLENLTVLSLRNNALNELPPAIAKLRNLKEFNIAGNNLKWLPYEIKSLLEPNGQLRRLTVQPNPFVECFAIPTSSDDFCTMWGCALRDRPYEKVSPDAEYSTWRHVQDRLITKNMNSITKPKLEGTLSTETRVIPSLPREIQYLGSSAVTYYDLDGRPLTSGSHAAASEELDYSLCLDKPDALPSSAVPTLLEVSLRACQKWMNLKDYAQYIPDAPRAVCAALDLALKLRNEGGQSCSVCGKQYILARAQWVEYYEQANDLIITRDSVIPFLRRGCSLACVRGEETEWVSLSVGIFT